MTKSALRLYVLALSALAAVGGCTSIVPPARTEVVLVPDPGGRVGRLEVVTPAGSQILSKGRTGVAVESGAPTEPEPVGEERVDREWRAALVAQPPPPTEFSLYFRAGSTELTPVADALLPRVAERLRGWPFPRLAVAGHTDAANNGATEVALARRRAAVVRDHLIAIGIAPSLIEESFHGARNPRIVAPNGGAEPRNQRVTVTIR